MKKKQHKDEKEFLLGTYKVNEKKGDFKANRISRTVDLRKE
jgi:hypothetical protein